MLYFVRYFPHYNRLCRHVPIPSRKQFDEDEDMHFFTETLAFFLYFFIILQSFSAITNLYMLY